MRGGGGGRYVIMGGDVWSFGCGQAITTKVVCHFSMQPFFVVLAFSVNGAKPVDPFWEVGDLICLFVLGSIAQFGV